MTRSCAIELADEDVEFVDEDAVTSRHRYSKMLLRMTIGDLVDQIIANQRDVHLVATLAHRLDSIVDNDEVWT